MSPKGPTFNFLIFYNWMNVEKAQRVPLLHFSALWDCSNFFRFFFKNFLYLQRSPSIFLLFRNKLDFQEAQRDPFYNFYTCDSKCYGKVRVLFFPRDNSLVSDRKSHNSDFFGLAVRCLLFNPEGPGSNPCLCANFFNEIFEAEDSLFSTIWDSPSPLLGFLRLIFENFLMSPKGPPFIFWYFATERTLKNSKGSLLSDFFRHYETVKNSHFFRKFFEVSNSPPSIFLNYRKRMDVKKSQRNPFSQFSALWDFSEVIIFVLKLGFLRPSTLYPIFFQRPNVFHMRLFQFFFHRSPPSIFTKNETFCDSKGLAKVFGTMRLQKNCR